MEMVEYSPEEDLRIPCPRGGPIYVTSLVGPITTVPALETSVMEELQRLEAELRTDSTVSFDEELSVEELKVFTEEELVERASKEAFKDAKRMESSSQPSEEHRKGMMIDDPRISSNENACLESLGKESSTSEPCASSSVIEASNNHHSKKTCQQGAKKQKKRGRAFDRNHRAAELESCCIAKVKELARLKQKQEEDKAAAKLHSFNGSAKINEGPISVSESVERMRFGFTTSAMKVKSSRTLEHVPVSHTEVVLTVEIYHNTKTCLKTQEFLVLGRQPLTELRDNIYCLTDQLMQKAGQHDPSGYFLIEDVFCNDRRDASSIDYSEPIFDWLRNCKDEAVEKWEDIIISGGLQKKRKALFGDEGMSHLPQFKAVDMHKTRFYDLRFRLGSGYLYCHQGDCRHIFVIRDMRLIHPDDAQNKMAYPILKFQHKHRWQKCCVCKTFCATKVTVDDKWSQENPSYFCDNCYFLLHYTEDGTLLYNEFTVYDCNHEV
ncbi:snRNA-activating protein complex subunit [Magnolia sinica]|uniref:snRNA-activating protein complex subunit n=1 Tax=Magnolia sinica TaxID=86752 RepID=UPI00265A3004|nr:snRNA-activating protein complex subunit [Magnolia sinica]